MKKVLFFCLIFSSITLHGMEQAKDTRYYFSLSDNETVYLLESNQQFPMPIELQTLQSLQERITHLENENNSFKTILASLINVLECNEKAISELTNNQKNVLNSISILNTYLIGTGQCINNQQQIDQINSN